MSYVAVELDALNKFPAVARAARVSEDTVSGGVLRLWAHCFRVKRDVLAGLEVAGCFATEVDLVPALVAFGFLEEVPEGFRVRGAGRYLRVTEGRSKGGHAAKGNLKRGPNRPGEEPGEEPRLSPAGPRLPPGSAPAASRAFTDDRRPTTDDRTPTVDVVGLPPSPVREAAPPPPPPATPPQLDAARARAVELHQHLQAPDAPPEAWGAEDFWRWAQATRRDAGKLLVEKWPDHRDLARWWGEARLVADVTALQEAFYRFGEDEHWQTAKPPLPWAGFGGANGQWAKFLPQGKEAARAAAR